MFQCFSTIEVASKNVVYLFSPHLSIKTFNLRYKVLQVVVGKVDPVWVMWSVLTDFGLFNRLFRKMCPKMVFFSPKNSGFWSKGLFLRVMVTIISVR